MTQVNRFAFLLLCLELGILVSVVSAAALQRLFNATATGGHLFAIVSFITWLGLALRKQRVTHLADCLLNKGGVYVLISSALAGLLLAIPVFILILVILGVTSA